MKFKFLILTLTLTNYAITKNIENRCIVLDNQLIEFYNPADTIKKNRIPKSIGSVNDFENIFTKTQITELDSIIKKFEIETGNQIAIVSVGNIDPYDDFFDYSLDLFNTWGIGQKYLDNGLLIIFSKNLRQVRITTGKGTEKFLTDAKCKKVIDEKMIPNFKNSLYYEGIKAALSELIKAWSK